MLVICGPRHGTGRLCVVAAETADGGRMFASLALGKSCNFGLRFLCHKVMSEVVNCLVTDLLIHSETRSDTHSGGSVSWHDLRELLSSDLVMKSFARYGGTAWLRRKKGTSELS